MAQLNDLIVTGSSRFLVDINGNLNGNAATSDNAAKLNGYASDTAATANTIVRRDANKYIYGTYFNANISNENINSYTNDPAIMFTSNDKWIRRTTKANLQTWLGLGSAAYKDASGSWGISITGSSASCTGNAATATKAINSETIIIDEQYYTTSTTNYIPFIDNTLALGETNILLANDGFRTRQINGTTSDVGETILVLGNNTAAGTAGNKSGKIWLYGNSAYRAALAFANGATANASHVFPTTGGTILNTGTTSFTQTLTSGTKIGSIKINGTSKDIFAPTTQASSRKIKTNIEPITTDEINNILHLEGVKFDFISKGSDTQLERGFIAEDVAKYIPEVVAPEETDSDGNITQYASINYLALIPYLVEICKKQQKEIDELKKI